MMNVPPAASNLLPIVAAAMKGFARCVPPPDRGDRFGGGGTRLPGGSRLVWR